MEAFSLRFFGSSLVATVLLVAFLSLPGCDSSGSSGGSCACTLDEQCQTGSHCDRCACVEDCQGPQDCTSPDLPNCDPGTGRCVGPCQESSSCTHPDFPNCGADGVCFGPCQDNAGCTNPDLPNCGAGGICLGPCQGPSGCTNPDLPNCDPETGLCMGPCPDFPCPDELPNCGADGVCFASCVTGGDCPPAVPNCDERTGVCFGACQVNADCPDPAFPNCDPETGLCFGPCSGNEDCPEQSPNCASSGLCVGLCTSHADCTLTSLPNCQLDSGLPQHGICGPPCADRSDCPSQLYPNCHPSPGLCQPPCADDDGCPAELWKCDTGTGLCYLPECTDDTGCSPPDTVCEDFHCVPGCETHADCDPAHRCDLVTAGHIYHCEPRDCGSDADCNPPATVCDTDGLMDPDGGGYCVAGCATHYDCRQLGLDCDPAAGTCSARDYGDIGLDCGGGCESGFCLTSAGNLCTAFCCTQHDCPPGWGCRPTDDGLGTGRTVDVCVELAVGQGEKRYGEPCVQHVECRSNLCLSQRCSESCCTHQDCDHVSGMDCMAYQSRTVCFPQGAGNDPAGALGCGTTGEPSDCRSNYCFTYYITDVDCPTNTCPAEYPNCYDYDGSGVNDCVHDMCVDHCCSHLDCPDYGGFIHYCGKWTVASYDVCLWHTGSATLAEGEACASNGQCRSNFCSPADSICRKRCCSDADCSDPLFPRCKLELYTLMGESRWANVCQP